MARDFSARTDIDNTDPTNFPDGRILDSNPPAANNGTAIVEAVLGDVIQFFYKLLRDASINASGNADTDSVNQFLDGLVAKIRETAASISERGTVEIATQLEVDAGTDTLRVITPRTFADRLSPFRLFDDSGWVPAPLGADANASFTNIACRQYNRVVVITGRFRADSETSGSAIVATIPTSIAATTETIAFTATAPTALGGNSDTVAVLLSSLNRNIVANVITTTPSPVYSFGITYITSAIVPG